MYVCVMYSVKWINNYFQSFDRKKQIEAAPSFNGWINFENLEKDWKYKNIIAIAADENLKSQDLQELKKMGWIA